MSDPNEVDEDEEQELAQQVLEEEKQRDRESHLVTPDPDVPLPDAIESD